ncbi:heat stress transcription factor A-4b-like [Henckelia pumila]|uniref:heat stress transcription factor A-4b-like n=1 Tax=Henckelia pumila TaxID=405737 RepID=UPI003C6DBFB9
MDASNGGSNSPAPFLVKTYEMVDDPSTNSVISWSHTGHSFVVWNPPEFARDLLPKYFKHNNFSSFIRQLNTYGFRKIDPDQWEFGNEVFIRGQRHLLKNIHRRKPIHSHSGNGNTVPLSDSEREQFEKEIEKLQQEKFVLQSEVDRCENENLEYKYQLRSLGQTLQTINQRQQQLMAILAQMLQKPGYASSLMDEVEPHNKKRRLLALNYLHDEANLAEDQSTTLQDMRSNYSNNLGSNAAEAGIFQKPIFVPISHVLKPFFYPTFFIMTFYSLKLKFQTIFLICALGGADKILVIFHLFHNVQIILLVFYYIHIIH